jgi:hypothetical protein
MTITDELLDERIRSSVPRLDASDWRDVRRRAIRKRVPAVLAVGVIIAILAAGPAFALRHQIADLWSSAEPAKNLYVRAFADCGRGSFTVEFDPIRGAVARQGADVLASASFTHRQIECDAPIQTFKGTPDEGRYPEGPPKAVSYEATTVRCQIGAALQVAVNPIWDEYRKIVGSTMLVAERATRQVIASAVMKKPDPGAHPGTSRIYYATDVCHRG